MRLLGVLLLAYTTLIAACPTAFNVGTADGRSDVISNCAPQAGWNPINNHEENPLSTTFRLMAIMDTSFQSQSYAIQFSYSVPNVVVIEMTPEQQIGTLTGGLSQPLDFYFRCTSDNGITRTLVTVTFKFTNPTNADVSFYFWKICQLPPLSIGSHGPGGLNPNIAIGGRRNPNFLYTASSDTVSDEFDIWIPNTTPEPYFPYFNFSTVNPIQPNGPVWITWTNKALLPSITATLSAQSVIPGETNPVRLSINYNCDNSKPFGSDTIHVTIENFFIPQLQFQYTKNCSYGNGIMNADIFEVVLKLNNDQAIQDGVPLSGWNQASGKGIPQNEHEVDLWAYITGNTREGQDMLPFNVTTQVTNNPMIMMINDGSTAPRSFVAVKQSLPGPMQLTVPIEITCLNSGDSTGRVTFDFGQQYNPISIWFTYKCSQPYFDIDHVNDDGTIVFEPVLIANVPQPWSYISPFNIKQEFFTIALNKDKTSYPTQDITFDNVLYDSSVMKRPQVLPTTAWFPLTQGTPKLFTILFDCIEEIEINISSVNITVDYGWNNKQYIYMRKECGGNIPTPAPSSSSGWSAAGIFFFTVFILTLVGCLTGAGYKYAKEDKRGWDVIPGITYYRSCYEQTCPTKRYTPQTDYYHDNVPDHGGKSYQTDL